MSMLFVSLSSPFLGGIADYAGLRKRLLAFYTSVCVLAVAAFSLLTPGRLSRLSPHRHREHRHGGRPGVL